MKKWSTVLICACAVAVLAAPAMSDEKKPEAGMEMTDDMASSMEPGEHHGHLAKLAGEYTYVGKMWTDPSAAPIEWTGMRSATMILGGRFLEETVTGQVMGMPFEGKGILAYDNDAGKYVFDWIDNFSTAITTCTGSCSDAGWELSGKHYNPNLKATTGFKNTIKMINAGSFVFEWQEQMPDGSYMKLMEITYKKKA